jgi:hypothetical protein
LSVGESGQFYRAQMARQQTETGTYVNTAETIRF